MLNWGRFRRSAPELAAAGRELIYQNGVGLALLGTVRDDGGPRVHPVSPIVVEEGLYALLLVSPKLADLVLGQRSGLSRLPWVNRRVRKWEPEPLRWLGVHALYAMYRQADRREYRSGSAATSPIARFANLVSGR